MQFTLVFLDVAPSTSYAHNIIMMDWGILTEKSVFANYEVTIKHMKIYIM